MSRYRGPRLRITRRLGELNGLTVKTSKKQNPPGQHGGSGMRKSSQYNLQLREKQKLRYNYGITERQLVNYIKKSRKGKGSSGKILLTFLEMRLDTIIFRLGFAPTIRVARQLISHKHICLNGNLVNIPSFLCRPGDIITVKNTKKSKNLVDQNLEVRHSLNVPEHLTLNRTLLEGKVNSIVNRASMDLLLNELLIIEYYSRKV
jgi:small subunit ribosomal protein S4|nr:ribosomal protein S4 [Eutreptiella sp. CCMP1594]